MKKFTLILVGLYQRLLSPDHSLLSGFFPHGFCRFYPSCSEYTRHAIQKKGLIRGIMVGCMRLLRCNPWNNGGIDHIH